MSGGKGGSSTSTVQIPEYIEKAAQRNLNKAEQISQIGYTPYYGPDVAAFSPTQQAAFQNTSNMANAFGMAAPTSTGMPQAMDFGGGITGYSSAPLYENAVGRLQQERPGQYSAISNLFIDPYSGGRGASALPFIDYTGFETAAQAAARQAELDRANQLAIAQANAGPDGMYYGGAAPSTNTAPSTSTNTSTSAPTYDYGGVSYDTSNQASTSITNPAIDASGIPVSTEPVSQLAGITNDITEALTGATIGLLDPTYKAGGVNNPIETPTIGEMVEAAPPNMNYNPATGAYVNDGNLAPTTSLTPPPQTVIDASRVAAGGGTSLAPTTSLTPPPQTVIDTSRVAAGGGTSLAPSNLNDPASIAIVNPVISAGGLPVSTGPVSPLTGATNNITEALTGATIGLLDPTYAVGGVNNPVESPTIGEMVAAAPPGMSYSPTTGGYFSDGIGEGGGGNFGGTANAPSSSPNPPSQAAIDASRGEGGGGGGGNKVICTALHNLNLLPDDIYDLDVQFGQRVNREDPALGDGYRLWATPIAEYIKGDSIGSKIALALVKPLATAWAKQMAHTMRPDEYKPNLAGKALMAVGHPACRLIGNIFARQIAATKEV